VVTVEPLLARYYRQNAAPIPPNPFRCEGFVRDATLAARNGVPLPIRALPAFLRALLVTDGTVTKIIEAYFWEPVHVDTLAQEFVVAAAAIPWIAVRAGERVLARHARLRGADSGHDYAKAFSVIRPEHIPADFRQRLIDREIGIGALIRDSGLESYREVLDIGLEPAADGDEEGLFRTYRIFIERAPVILITETFPLARYR